MISCSRGNGMRVLPPRPPGLPSRSEAKAGPSLWSRIKAWFKRTLGAIE